MKKVILSVAVVAFAMSFASCKKCEDCSILSSTPVEYCGDELDAAKLAGFSCS
jgi:hypothetical protein